MAVDLSAAPPPRLQCRNITKRFGGVVALSDVSIDARAGEVHAICGENGAGKSTLMKIASGVLLDYDGRLLVDGAGVRFLGPRDAEECGIRIIHQELNLVPGLSAAANLFLGRETTRAGFWLDDRAMERSARQLLDQLGAHFEPRTRVRDLRVGDQQLVEIARALAMDSAVLIMDEPTSALADAEVERLFAVIDHLKRQRVGILYISHRMDEVFRIADRITVLRDGQHVRTVFRSDTNPSEVIRAMVGRELAELSEPPADSRLGPEILRTRGLCVPDPQHPGRWFLENVDLEVRQGEIVGIAGLLGAGRTTLLECLFGSGAGRWSGEVFIDQRPVRMRSPVQAMAQGIALVTEDRKRLALFPSLTVAANITLSHLTTLARYWVFRWRRERRAASEQVARLGIKTPSLKENILRLSGGNQQKCVLGRWLLTRPRILLLDEPTRGIDVGAKADIYRLLRELAGEGLAIVMTSSELPELLGVCNRIAVLCEGRKTAEFPRSQATQEAILHAAMAFR